MSDIGSIPKETGEKKADDVFMNSPTTPGTTITDATFIRKISNQAETDEKPIEKVEHLKQWLVGFGEQNKAHIEKHSVKHPYPKSRSRCTGTGVDDELTEAEDDATDIRIDDELIISKDDAVDIRDEPKENIEPFTPAPALDTCVASSSNVCGHNTDETPLESVSELKQWLMRSGRQENTERCERKLVNELSTRMTRDEAVKTAKSYMRKISDQAVCEEQPLLHVAEAKQFLMDFEKNNKEHFEKNSIKHPNKRLSRCRGAKDDDENFEETVVNDATGKNIEALAALPDAALPEDEIDVESEIIAEAEDSMAGDNVETPMKDDGVVEEKEMPEEGEEVEEQPAEEEDDTVEVEEEELHVGTEIQVQAEEVEEVEEVTVEKDEGTEEVYGEEDTSRDTTLEGNIRDLDEISRISEPEKEASDASAVFKPENEHPLKEAPDASAVFRKRYLVDDDEEDAEEKERPMKMRRGLGLLKKLGCPVKVFGKTNNHDVEVKAGLPKNPIVTMASSADEDPIAPGRAPPQVQKLVGLGAASDQSADVKNQYHTANVHTLLSPNSDITMNDFQERSSATVANEMRSFYNEKLTRYTQSPASSTDSGSTDMLPTETIIAKAGISAGDDVAAVHLKWLENKFSVDQTTHPRASSKLHEF